MPSMGTAHGALASGCQLLSPPALGRILHWAGLQGPHGSSPRQTQHFSLSEPGNPAALAVSTPAAVKTSSGSARQVQTPGPPGEVWPSSVCRARWGRQSPSLLRAKPWPPHGLALLSPESGTTNHGDLLHCRGLGRRLRLSLTASHSPWKPNKHHHPCPKLPAHPSPHSDRW